MAPSVAFDVLRRPPPHRARLGSGRPLEEQSGWEAHAAFMDGLVTSGFVVLGGPLEDERAGGAGDRGRVGGRCPRDARPRSVDRDPSRGREHRRAGRSASTAASSLASGRRPSHASCASSTWPRRVRARRRAGLPYPSPNRRSRSPTSHPPSHLAARRPGGRDERVLAAAEDLDAALDPSHDRRDADEARAPARSTARVLLEEVGCGRPGAGRSRRRERTARIVLESPAAVAR